MIIGVAIASPIVWHVPFLTSLNYFEFAMTPSASSLHHYKTSSKPLIVGYPLSIYAHFQAAAASDDGIKNPSSLQTIPIASLITSVTDTNVATYTNGKYST